MPPTHELENESWLAEHEMDDAEFNRAGYEHAQEIQQQEDESDEENFECCLNCIQPDACEDFGCAIKQGLQNDDLPF